MSTPPNSPRSKAVIPEALRLQLDEFRRHVWRMKILEAVAAGVIGLLLSFLLVYGLDRIWQTPGWVRLAILLAGVSLFAGFAPYWVHRWVWGQRQETQLARLIARRYPGLGDRLLGVIELQNQEGSADSLSPRLRQAAMEAVAMEVGKRSLSDALPQTMHRRGTLVALALIGICGAAFLFTPRAGVNALKRWLLPLSDTERYTFTKLDAPSKYIAVAIGESFEISLRLAKESEQRPGAASGRFGLQTPVEVGLDRDAYRFKFPGQQDPGVIQFSVGDLRHTIRIQPVPRPSMEQVTASLIAPSYLGIPERTTELNTGVLRVVEGSKIKITLQMTRPLSDASFGPTRLQANGESEGSPEIHTSASGKLDLAGSQATTPEISVGAQPFEIPFAWVDEIGLAGEQGFRLRIDAAADAAPTVYLQGIDRQKVLLPEETIDFEVLAEDDFGVREMGIEWTGQFTRPSEGSPAQGETVLQEGSFENTRLIKNAAFSPAAFGIGPQKIILRGYSEDYLPERGRVYSEPVVLYILTRDEHAQMLKTKFDRNITEFEDLARREIDLLDENQRLERLSGDELQNEDNAKRLNTQKEQEAESERRMQELTERMESLMKDAARNGDIAKETLKKMAESLKSMQELSAEDLPKVKEQLSDAQEPSNAPEKSQKDIASAVEKQKEAVEKMQAAIAKANEANRDFEAGTFVNRLQKAASEQAGIAKSLIDAYEKMLGIKQAKLDPKEQRRLSEASSQQANTASDVRWLQEDLGHYFARTDGPIYKEILDEMRNSQIDLGLDGVRGMLATNHTYRATEATQKWADQLSIWAKKLEGKSEEASQGGEGGGGPSPEDEDFEFMLRVMKLIQQEQDLRGQTRVLEQLRRNPDKES